jgi:hypothetical protein
MQAGSRMPSRLSWRVTLRHFRIMHDAETSRWVSCGSAPAWHRPSGCWSAHQPRDRYLGSFLRRVSSWGPANRPWQESAAFDAAVTRLEGLRIGRYHHIVPLPFRRRWEWETGIRKGRV